MPMNARRPSTFSLVSRPETRRQYIQTAGCYARAMVTAEGIGRRTISLAMFVIVIASCGAEPIETSTPAPPLTTGTSVGATEVETTEVEATVETTEVEATATTRACVTVPTTIPGDVFCDGYQPFPDTPVTRTGCPDWAITPVTRPADGWLGTNGPEPKDGLWRRSTEQLYDHEGLVDFASRARSAAPNGFALSTSEAMASPACIEESVSYSLSFNGPDGAVLWVLRTRLIGQANWFEEGYAPTDRSSSGDGTEFATYDEPAVVKVWMAAPDGTLVKITAYGANADRRFGFPTTTTGRASSLPATPLTICAEDLLAMARSLAG